MNFLQLFIWGTWLITVGNYWFATKQWSGTEFGAIFSTLGFSSLVMPTLIGIIADRFMNAEKLYGLLHILGGIALWFIPSMNTPTDFFYLIFFAMICYMPTISLGNAIGFTILKNNGYDVVKTFPPIRVWGTIGFIVAMWITNLTGNKATTFQFYFGGVSAIFLGVFAFFMPACPPSKESTVGKSWTETFGLNAFKLFANYKMALFFIFSMFLGAALQLTNMYGDTFLSDFEKVPAYFDSFVVRYSTIIMSISQISETLFILAIPFFLKRFGIKKVMLFSMIAWVLRFGLFSFGNPTDGLWMIIVSCIVYGLAFDFFNISGSLFVETNTDAKMRSSAQGLFMMMSNGIGAIMGSLASGYFISKYFTFRFQTEDSLLKHLNATKDNPAVQKILGNCKISNGVFETPVEIRDWHHIWLSFALYALVIAIAFSILFKHKHDPEAIESIQH